jgi:hypothetical protein
MVAVTGERRGVLEPTEFANLLGDFERSGFFDMPERLNLDRAPFDSPTAEFTVRTSSQTKTVRFHYYGDRPKELLYLMDRVMTLTNATQWLCPRPYWPTPTC